MTYPLQLQIVNKEEFNGLRSKYKDISPNAESEILKADNSDTIVLKVKEGSPLSIISAKIISETDDGFFNDLMVKGVDAF